MSRETTVADPGGGSRGSGPLPIRPDACLRLEFFRRQDRISLFIFFNETPVAFCY